MACKRHGCEHSLLKNMFQQTVFKQPLLRSSLSSNSWGRLSDVLGSLLLCFLSLAVLNCRLLSGRLLLLLGSSHSLLSLGLTDLGLLVTLGHDILKRCSNNSPLELLGSLVPFLGSFLLQPLLVLPAVQHGPGHLTRVPFQHVGFVSSS